MLGSDHKTRYWWRAIKRCTRNSLWIGAGVLVAGLASATTTNRMHWQDARYIESSFYDIALRSEYERVAPVVKKWRTPLRIWVESHSGDREKQQSLLEMHFSQIGDITDLPYRFVTRKDRANVRVVFASEQNFQAVVKREMGSTAAQQASHSVCLGHIRYNKRSEITRGAVVIPVERAQRLGKLVPCMVEELTQMMGLINDSQVVSPTVFSDITDDDLLTGLDYLLLRLLYSPQVRSGMTAREAAPVLRHQLRLWEMDGSIRLADARISKGALHGLYQL